MQHIFTQPELTSRRGRKHARNTVVVGTMIGGALLTSFWLTSRVTAQEQNGTELLAYGVVGLGQGQTARVNVVTVGLASDIVVEMSFLDRQGNIIARSVERAVPGHAVSLDLRFPDRVDAIRIPFRAVVRYTTPSPKRGYVIPSLELIDDAAGRTVLALPNPEG